MFQLLIGTNFPFMQYRRMAYFFSGGIALATVIWLVAHGGPKYSVDFTGGTLLQIRLSRVLPADQVRQAFDAAGLKGVELQQMAGESRDEVLIRVQRTEGQGDIFGRARDAIRAHAPDVAGGVRRTGGVGAQGGGERRRQRGGAGVG